MIEMVVVLAVIAILAAILTPIVTSYVERARVNTATNDVKNIAAAIVQFNTDTKIWPIYSSTTGFPTDLTANINDVEATTGNEAVVGTGTGWTLTSDGDLNAIVNQNNMNLALTGTRAWKGAYGEMNMDPWGTKYYFTSRFLKPGFTSTHGASTSPSAVFVISAGPNQTLDTNFDQATSAFAPSGDDIIARIK